MTHPQAPLPQEGCCSCILSFTLTSAFTAFFLWLSLRPHYPACSIEQFYVSSLNNNNNNNNKTLHSNPILNRTIVTYDLKLNNRNNDEGVFYDALNLTFYYKSYNTNTNTNTTTTYYPIGGGTHSGFYQGHGKHTHRDGVVVLTTTAAAEAAEFRAELETAVRFKIVFWKTRRRRLVVGGDLKVDDHGELVRRKKNKGIKLSNNGGVNGVIKGWFRVLISLLSLVIVVVRLW